MARVWVIPRKELKMAYRYDYSVFRNNGRNNKGNNNGYTNNNSTTNDKNEFKAPRELVSISLRDNRVGAYSESGSFNHSYFYNDVTIGALTELEAVLDKINDNDTLEDTIKIIHIPNVILALITGLGDYIRIGKTTNGTVLSQEKIEANLFMIHQLIFNSEKQAETTME